MALGDTIYLQLGEDIIGWGKGGTVVGPITETLTTEALVTNGLAKVVAGPGVVTAGVAFTDGQIPVWSATLGVFVPANPTGASELAAAYNVTGTATAASAAAGVGAAVDIPGTAISVPNSGGRPVTLHCQANAQQTVAGTGQLLLQIIETTSGSTSILSVLDTLPNATATPLAFLDTAQGQLSIGAVTTTRTFKLQAQLWSPAGNSPTINILNASNNPSSLRAVAG